MKRLLVLQRARARVPDAALRLPTLLDAGHLGRQIELAAIRCVLIEILPSGIAREAARSDTGSRCMWTCGASIRVRTAALRTRRPARPDPVRAGARLRPARPARLGRRTGARLIRAAAPLAGRVARLRSTGATCLRRARRTGAFARTGRPARPRAVVTRTRARPALAAGLGRGPGAGLAGAGSPLAPGHARPCSTRSTGLRRVELAHAFAGTRGPVGPVPALPTRACSGPAVSACLGCWTFTRLLGLAGVPLAARPARPGPTTFTALGRVRRASPLANTCSPVGPDAIVARAGSGPAVAARLVARAFAFLARLRLRSSDEAMAEVHRMRDRLAPLDTGRERLEGVGRTSARPEDQMIRHGGRERDLDRGREHEACRLEAVDEAVDQVGLRLRRVIRDGDRDVRADRVRWNIELCARQREVTSGRPDGARLLHRRHRCRRIGDGAAATRQQNTERSDRKRGLEAREARDVLHSVPLSMSAPNSRLATIHQGRCAPGCPVASRK